MPNKFSALQKALVKGMLAGFIAAVTSAASAQNSLAVDAMNAATGKAPATNTVTAVNTGAPAAVAVTVTNKTESSDAVTKKAPVVEVETSIRPKGKRATRLPLNAASNADNDTVAAPSKLTRKQDELDQLDKDDQIEARRLSIASKQKQYRALSGADEGRLRGSMKVMGIEGRARDLVATVRYATGEEFEVRTGDIMPDGKKVSAISSTGVTLSMGRFISNIPITLASGRATAPRSDSLPVERMIVPMGGPIPAPAAISR